MPIPIFLEVELFPILQDMILDDLGRVLTGIGLDKLGRI